MKLISVGAILCVLSRGQALSLNCFVCFFKSLYIYVVALALIKVMQDGENQTNIKEIKKLLHDIVPTD
jgi:hypothetical protein